MNETKCINCSDILDSSIESEEAKKFLCECQKRRVFDSFAKNIEGNIWYLLKFDQGITSGACSLGAKLYSKLKYLPVRDVNVLYPKPFNISVKDDDDSEIKSVVSLETHDDLRAELSYTKMELDDYKRAYDDLQETYKALVEKCNMLIVALKEGGFLDDKDKIIR